MNLFLDFMATFLLVVGTTLAAMFFGADPYEWATLSLLISINAAVWRAERRSQ